MSSEPTVTLVSREEVPVEHPDIDPIKSFVAGVLGLEPALNPYWDIIDYWYSEDENSPQLVKVLANDKFNVNNRFHEPLIQIRGTVIDLDTGAIVSTFYGYTEALPVFEPLKEEKTADSPQGILSIATQTKKYINSYETAPEEIAKIGIGKLQLIRASVRLALGCEGTMVCFFKWNNIVFFSTHKRIDATESRWADRPGFFQAWNRLAGFDPATLFGNEPTSPYNYLFLIKDSDANGLASSTRDNRVIFIGVKKVWNESDYAQEDGPYEWPESFKVKLPPMTPDSSAFSLNHDHTMVVQSPISVELANKFLFPNLFAADLPLTKEVEDYKPYGEELIVQYNPSGHGVEEIYTRRTEHQIVDDRTAGGDFLIAYVQRPDGETVVYRLESPGFEFRVKITDNDPNLYHRFVTKTVEFTQAKPEEITNEYPSYTQADGKRISLREPADRMNYWYSLFYDSVNPHFKKKVDGFARDYENDIKKVATFVLKEFSKLSDPEELKRVTDRTKVRMGDLLSRTGTSKLNMSPHQIMQNLLYNETGPSFYRMITTTKNIEKYRAQKLLVTSTAEKVLAASQ